MIHPDLFEICEKINDNAKKAGNATEFNLFRNYIRDQTCFCFADNCTPE